MAATASCTFLIPARAGMRFSNSNPITRLSATQSCLSSVSEVAIVERFGLWLKIVVILILRILCLLGVEELEVRDVLTCQGREVLASTAIQPIIYATQERILSLCQLVVVIEIFEGEPQV